MSGKWLMLVVVICWIATASSSSLRAELGMSENDWPKTVTSAVLALGIFNAVCVKVRPAAKRTR